MQSFAVSPSDGPPQGKMEVPIIPSRFWSSGKWGEVEEVPSMKVMVALAAPREPPDTGASKNVAVGEAEAMAVRTRSDVAVSIVEQSMRSLEERSADRMPVLADK